jgi:magnesium-transporting ATPase (P-type)
MPSDKQPARLSSTTFIRSLPTTVVILGGIGELIPMFDPPRDYTQETIHRAESLGVEVKTITGDHLTIAKETARVLDMGVSIFPAEYMEDAKKAHRETGLDLNEIIHQAHGFAQVPKAAYVVFTAASGSPSILPFGVRCSFRRSSTPSWRGCRKVTTLWA